jgi:hypothetical protein
MSEDRLFNAMKAQARFESCAVSNEENQLLYDWLCAEIEHANECGIDWIQKPSRMIESRQDYNTFKLFARNLSKIRAVATTSHIKVA